MNTTDAPAKSLMEKGNAASKPHAGRGFLGAFLLALTAILIWVGLAFGAEQKTVVVGFTASQTGSLNVEGIRQINGVCLWVDDVNAAGGIPLADGTKVKVAAKFYDGYGRKFRPTEAGAAKLAADAAKPMGFRLRFAQLAADAPLLGTVDPAFFPSIS